MRPTYYNGYATTIQGGKNMKPRVRYAPSPTGHLHIGNARTALFNYLFARKKGGSFIIRIEDTDTARNIAEGTQSQLEQLAWLGIDWDESVDKGGSHGPYRQLERLDIYEKYAQKLLDAGKAYKCYCTEEELAEERRKQKEQGATRLHYSRKCLQAPEKDAPYAIRFLVPADTEYTFRDMIKGEVTFRSEDVGDFVIMKKNGIPTYNFACAVDDALMEITHVLRGEDHITNTPRQLMILDELGFQRPVYGHMPLIVNLEGKKLSKRDESIIQFIEQYRSLGFLPEAMFNFIALLGWSPAADEEIFSREELVERFDEDRMASSPAAFDTGKLHYVNNRHMKKLSRTEVLDLCRPFLEAAGIGKEKDDEWLESLVAVFHDRLSYGKEIVSQYEAFFSAPFVIDGEALEFLRQEGVKELLTLLREKISLAGSLDAQTLKTLIKETGKEQNMKGKMLFMPVRIAVSGSMKGPDLPEMMNLLGRDTLLERLDHTLEII